MSNDNRTVLQIEDLKTYFYTEEGEIPAVDGVTVSLERGKVLAIVGESGCGKSVTSYSILRLIRKPGKIVGGKILFFPEKGEPVDIAALDESSDALYKVRGGHISMIFQEPMTALSPVHTINNQISEAILLHQDVTPKQARERAIEMLRKVGIPGAERRIDQYPHEMSGGLRQRIMIAMAVSCGPRLLLLDEPTTALDVTVQLQVLKLLERLCEDTGTSLVFVTHDLAVVNQTCSELAVMYAGHIVESGRVKDTFRQPRHPYTRGLLESAPDFDRPDRALVPIPGFPPNVADRPHGCPFAPRCGYVRPHCTEAMPPLAEVLPGRLAACFESDRLDEVLA